jgi:integrase
LRLYRRASTWHCTFYDARGARVRRSTHCRDRKAAEARARQWERDAADPDHAAARDTTLTDALTLFLEYFEGEVTAGKRAPETLAAYRKQAGHLVRILETDVAGTWRPRPLASFTVCDTRAYIRQRRAEEVCDSTIAKELIPLRVGLRLAAENGRWRGDVARVIPVDFTPSYRPRQRWLTREEMHQLIAALPVNRAAVVAFVVATSAEWRAVERARRADAPTAGGAIFLRGTKRATRMREVPIESEGQREFLAFALAHADGEGELLFRPWGSVRRDLRAACVRAGIDACSPNDLRRTFGSWMLQAGVPLVLIARMMGHIDTRMVERVYGQMRTEDVAAQLRAVVRAGPIGHEAPTTSRPGAEQASA